MPTGELLSVNFQQNGTTVPKYKNTTCVGLLVMQCGNGSSEMATKLLIYHVLDMRRVVFSSTG
jgi:hypothetical protein